MYKFELTNTTIVTRGGKTQNYYLCRVLEKPDETCKGYRFIESKLFNKELFLSNLMKNLVNYNNLHTKARGYNKSKLLYSENIALIVYDINIAVMLSEDMIIPKIEIENTEQTLLINS